MSIILSFPVKSLARLAQSLGWKVKVETDFVSFAYHAEGDFLEVEKPIAQFQIPTQNLSQENWEEAVSLLSENNQILSI